MNFDKLLDLFSNIGFWAFVGAVALGTFRRADLITAVFLAVSLLFFALFGLGHLWKRLRRGHAKGGK